MRDIFFKIGVKTLWKNKKRAVATIVGIVISVALITAILSITKILKTSMEKSNVENEKWAIVVDYAFEEPAVYDEVTKEEALDNSIGNPIKANSQYKNILDILPEYENGIYVFPNSMEIRGYVYSLNVSYLFFDGDSFNMLNSRLTKGSLPRLENEVAISIPLASNKDLDIGDRIDIYDPNTSSYKEAEVSGIVSLPYFDDSVMSDEAIISNDITLFKDAQIYGVFSYNDIAKKFKDEVIEPEDFENIGGIYQIKTTKDHNINKMMIISFLILVLITTGGFILIYNTFAISLRERRKAYSIMESVGATPSQKWKVPIYESIIFAIISIPLGIFFGAVLTKASLQIAGEKLISVILPDYDTLAKVDMPLDMVASAIAISIVLIFLASILPAIRHVDIFNVVEMKEEENRIPSRENSLSDRIAFEIGNVFHMAYVHFFANKRYFMPTSISIIMVVTLFVTGTGIIKYAKASENDFISRAEKYNISISNDEEHNIGSTKEAFQLLNNRKELIKHKGNRMFYEKIKLSLYVADESLDYDLYILDDASYNKYIKYLDSRNLINKIEKISNPQIIGLDYITTYDKNGNKLDKMEIFKNQREISYLNMDKKSQLAIEAYGKQMPKGITGYLDRTTLVTSQSYAKENIYYHRNQVSKEELLIDVQNADETILVIENLLKEKGITVDKIENIENLKDELNGIIFVITLLAYAFSFLLSIIAGANAFNAISSNIDNRKLEFITLVLIGIEEKKLYRMIILENIMLLLRSLVYGLALSVLLLYIPYVTTSTVEITGYIMPVESIAAVIVGGILGMIVISMYVSMRLKSRVLDNISVIVGEENI